MNKQQFGDFIASNRKAAGLTQKALADRLESKQIIVKIKAGEGGKAFGSVSSKEIATACKEQHGIEIDKKKIILPESLKSFGSYEVGVKLHPQVTAKLAVRVAEA